MNFSYDINPMNHPRFKRFLLRVMFLLLLYFIIRLGFYYYHLTTYIDYPFSDLLLSFIYGLRFDLAAILLINAPLYLLSLFLPQSKEKLIFLFINFLAFLISLNDFELFLFLGKRLSYDVFFIASDALSQLPQLLIHYWYLPLSAFFLTFILMKAEVIFSRTKEVKYQSPLSFGIHLFVVGISFLGIRGGLQLKSIDVQSAFTQGHNDLGHLVLNTPYHFIRTLKRKTPKKRQFFKNKTEMLSLLKSHYSMSSPIFTGSKKANVVLIVLESFSLEYFEKGYMPFLSELKKKGLFFERHLANGRRSIEALPSLLCGLPSLFNDPISKSIFSSNSFKCLPQLLKKFGYYNAFFHGGHLGTMAFDSFSLSHGFDRYFSKEDYGQGDYDGNWGVFDYPYLEYVVDELNHLRKPFFSTIFTLSSHQPYTLPKEFQNRFPKGSLPIHESIGYVDFALKNFFQKSQTQPWFKNTFFILTADHAQIHESKKFKNMIGRYRVPLLILGPHIDPGMSSKVTQHSDIPKTVLDLLDIEEQNSMPLATQSVLQDGLGHALNYAGGVTYFLAQGDSIYTLNEKWSMDWKTGQIIEKKKDTSLILKASLQYFINGLISNNLSY